MEIGPPDIVSRAALNKAVWDRLFGTEDPLYEAILRDLAERSRTCQERNC